ncbi:MULTISPECIES: helix-turn-helix transcriptional regulator [unclassified Paenibacillus]|uniref:helix-turn-helix transcriptional regulator n=1 Tax=unclassified Paenibacillus TaxID=185978 RepID=UPI00089AD4E7|nr:MULTISPECIES: YafY family protein [unclassified Paenibacillus]SEB20759.1 Predicted DNA-binding transcriptional regulator YafY, contains an HTH and WYL domains [Paenibacillus sp. 276b]SLK17587.1 Predicted DNA-binding transcriptional regulator YafY, contains an HTH and WYL domains [Paenibacillus sp. RU5A]SOC74862.1 Predicted DNA-binding transcriptional regulator YafY, contains an HTH and WYL domains [Paenibacillus sp. RU26A]SOC76981.1 Predicted DNA-binding transcriptional regulator YafY, conta
MNNRKLALMRLMDSRKKFTARELAERFQVSIRTIQRDLNDLQELGFPLYTEVGVNGGYRVLPNRILPPLQLTQHEALGLFMMIEYLENVPDFPYGSIREHLAEEYYSTLPQDVQDLITRMRQHITFLQHHAVQVEAVTTEILGAAVDQREIEFIYHSRQGHKKVQVFPIGIYYDHGYWYMPASRKDRVLLYRVDRMQELVMLDSIDESVPSLKEWLNYKENRKSVEVVLQFTDFGARLAGSDVLFKSVGGNEWRGLVPPEEFPFTARKLLSYGPEVKVIEPLELQQQVREMLERSLNQY